MVYIIGKFWSLDELILTVDHQYPLLGFQAYITVFLSSFVSLLSLICIELPTHITWLIYTQQWNSLFHPWNFLSFLSYWLTPKFFWKYNSNTYNSVKSCLINITNHNFFFFVPLFILVCKYIYYPIYDEVSSLNELFILPNLWAH